MNMLRLALWLRNPAFRLGGRVVAFAAEEFGQIMINVIVLLSIYAFLISIFKPDLMLSETITTGGDTASHYYPAKFLRDELLPRGHIIGWLPGWYAGMPLFQYYFPLPFLMIAVMGYVIPLQISFKLVSVAGTFLLPVACFACMKLMRFKFPVPIYAALFSLPFLFMESHSMWGGNIPSTLAGEFSYSLSLSLTILFFGTLYRGLEDRRYILHNALLLAAVALTHVYTVLWVVCSSAYMLVTNSLAGTKERITYMAKSYPLAFLLTGFWIIPLLVRLKYTTSYDIAWVITEDTMPPILWPFLIFSFVGAYRCIAKREHRMGFFCFSIVTSLVFFRQASMLGVVDIRFLPFVYLALLILAAYGLSQATGGFKAKLLLPLIVLILTVFWVTANKAVVTAVDDNAGSQGIGGAAYIHFSNDPKKDSNLAKPGVHINLYEIPRELRTWKYSGFTPYWIQWNYEGFEKKPLWTQFKSTNEFMSGGYNDSRAQFEHNDQHNSAGTVRAYESIPLFSGRSILEGVYMQSIESSPFVFYMQSEFSEQQSCPFWAGYPCTSFNLEHGTRHLKMFNVRYLVVRSQKLKDAIRENPEWKLGFADDPYEVWELTTNPEHYVTVPNFEPVLYRTSDWKNISYQWFRNLSLYGVPIVFKGDTDSQDRERFPQIVENPAVSSLQSLPMTPLNRECNIRENIGAEEMEFDTDCVGAPHIISISYYPSWVPEGADRVYLVSPSFMLLYPTQTHVKLTYSKLPEDWVGILLTMSASAVIAYAFLGRDERARRFFGLD
ncbi:MAG: 6-pyruvoyl-tetrahydropterin synthase-related protein [Candidatus Altiarchaeota archaeon]